MFKRGERGQIIILFALCVPIGLALLVFLLDMWKVYYVHSANQRLADSVARTVESILKDGAVVISEEELPSSVASYSPTEDQIALKKLESAIDFLKDEAGADIAQRFMIDGDENIYYRIDAEHYSSIFKIVGDDEIDIDPADLTEQLLNATAEEKTVIINELVSPSTPEQKSINIKILSGFFKNPLDATNASAVALALLNDAAFFSDQEKGKLFDFFLTGKLSEAQLQNINVNTFKTLAISEAPDIDVRSAKEILYAALRVMPSVSRLDWKLESPAIIIIYADSAAAKMYHKVTIKPSKNNQDICIIQNVGSDEEFTVNRP